MNQKDRVQPLPSPVSSLSPAPPQPSFSPSPQHTSLFLLGMRGRGVEGAEEGLVSPPLQSGVRSPSFPPFPSPAPPRAKSSSSLNPASPQPSSSLSPAPSQPSSSSSPAAPQPSAHKPVSLPWEGEREVLRVLKRGWPSQTVSSYRVEWEVPTFLFRKHE